MRAEFEDAFARYPRLQSATPKQEPDFNELGDEQSAAQPATAEPQSETAPDSVAVGTGDVADGVAVAQGENPNEINTVADVAVPHGNPRGGLRSMVRNRSSRPGIPARLPKPGDLLAVVAAGVTLKIAS
jgi:hypothetical protein